MNKVFSLIFAFISVFSYGQVGKTNGHFNKVDANVINVGQVNTKKIVGIDSTEIDNANGPGDSLVLFTSKGLKFKKVIEGNNVRFDHVGDSTIIINSGLTTAQQIFYPKAGETNTNAEGFTYTGTGTLVARIPDATSLLSSSNRVGLQTGTTAGSIIYVTASTPSLWRGNTAGSGGFYVSLRFGVPANLTGSYQFYGLTPSTISSSVAPSTLTNILGVGKDAADGTFQFMYNATAATATRVSTPITISSSDVYELILSAPSNGSSVTMVLKDLTLGTSATTTAASNIPASTQFLKFIMYLSNNATASAAGFDILKIYTESKY